MKILSVFVATFLFFSSLSYGSVEQCRQMRKSMGDADSMVAGTISSLSYSTPDIAKDPKKVAALKAKLQTYFNSEEFNQMYCDSLKPLLSDEDMKQITGFYSTAFGKKMKSLIPKLFTTSMKSVTNFLATKSKELEKEGLPPVRKVDN